MKAYSIRDASKILGVKVRTIRDWISKGQLRAFKRIDKGGGHYWGISEEEINRLRKELSKG